jgi:hypothetical protein
MVPTDAVKSERPAQLSVSSRRALRTSQRLHRQRKLPSMIAVMLASLSKKV